MQYACACKFTAILARMTVAMKRSDPLDIDVRKLSAAFTNHDLCTRSGTCVGICPEEALIIDAQGYPELIPGKCTACGICEKTCPGAKVMFHDLAMRTFGRDPNNDGFDGHVIDTQMAYSSDERMRSKGAGGGVVTAVLWDLLKSGEVSGCLVTRMNKGKPWRGEAYIARNYEELIESQGSKYLLISLNAMLKALQNEPGTFAVAALPCHVHGIRKAMANEPWVREKVKVIIGLFCGGALEPEVVTDMLRTKGLKKEDISGFQFRGGEWPGKIRAIRKDGTICNLHYSNYKDGAYNYFIGLYMPMRCRTCIDGSNEFSDFSISDAWTKNKYGEYIFKGCSKVLIRTDLGVKTIRKAADRGSIRLIDINKNENYRTQKLQTKRKGIIAPLRVKRLGDKGIDVPVYDRAAPDTAWKEKLIERCLSGLLFNAKRMHVRYFIIKYLTSRIAIPLIHFRLWMKSKKYQKRNRE